MKCLLPLVLAGLAFLAPSVHARTVLVADANNEKAVTLGKGDTLVIRLAANPSTGFSWSLVSDPLNDTLRLSGKPRYIPAPTPPGVVIVGSGGTQEFRFTVASSGSGGWLRLLYLQTL